MAGDIKGITIEFRGDTTELDKALRQIMNETKALDRELRSIDKALKFNPTSVDLWRQKQAVLTQKVNETTEKLNLLREAKKKLDADPSIDKESAEYRDLQREIISTESKLKHFEAQLRQIGNVNLRAASEQFKVMGSKLEAAGQSMRGLSTAAAAATASIGALTVKSGKWADDINTMSKVYSMSTTDLQKYSAAAKLVDVDVDTIAKSHLRLTKAMSGSEDETGAQAEAFAKLGVSVTDANGNLRDADDVWNDVIKALGGIENEAERDAIAMTLMGKSAAELNPLIEDGGETYQRFAETLAKYNLDFIDEETLSRANQFNDALDTIRAIGLVAFQQLGTQLAAYLAPALEKVVDWVGRLAEWISQLDPRVLTIIAAITGLVAVLAPLLIGLGKVSFAISSILSLMATLGPAIGGIVAAFGPVILIIGAVIAAGVLLYKNWDTIKAKAIEIRDNLIATWNNIKANVIAAVNNLKATLSGAWDSVKATVSAKWNAIKTAITTPIQNAVDIVRSAIDKIKNIVNNAKLSLPHIKLPHFSISGKFSLNPPSIPKVSVSWYKSGGIFSSPTIAGIGEAGPEAVVPLDILWKKLDNIAAASESGGDNITINVYASAGMDINELASAVEQRLVILQKQRAKAWGY